MFTLKRLQREGIEGALAKAERYRLLNEPWQAESICRDVLEVEPENQRAVIGLLLALTDQFARQRAPTVEEVRALLPRLEGEYKRAYYEGIICERRGNALWQRHTPGSGPIAYDWFRQAMEHYERADGLKTPGNEEAALRWNTCARMLMKYPELEPAATDDFQPMLE